MNKKQFFTSKNIAYLAILLALVVVLQVWGGAFTVGLVSLSFVLVPIVLGAIMIGPLAGAFLGFAFGVIVVVNGAIGRDPMTLYLLTEQPVFTAFLCLVKGTAAGFVSGLVYRALKNKNKYAAVFVASAVAPVVNTGIFLLGALCMFNLLKTYLDGSGFSVGYFLAFLITVCNFLPELGIDLVAAPALYRVGKIFMRDAAAEEEEKEEKETETVSEDR